MLGIDLLINKVQDNSSIISSLKILNQLPKTDFNVYRKTMVCKKWITITSILKSMFKQEKSRIKELHKGQDQPVIRLFAQM